MTVKIQILSYRKDKLKHKCACSENPLRAPLSVRACDGYFPLWYCVILLLTLLKKTWMERYECLGIHQNFLK